MPSMKNTLKTVQVKISQIPKFAKTAWLKLRGGSSSIRPAVGPLSVASILPLVYAGNGGSEVQVAEPRFATGSLAVSTSILPSAAAPPAVHTATPHHFPQPNQDITQRPHHPHLFPVSASCVVPDGTQAADCSPNSGSVLTEVSHESNGFSHSQGSGRKTESPYDTPYQTSYGYLGIEPSPCLSLAGTSSANAFKSTFNEIILTPLTISPRAALGLSIYDYSARSRPESSVSTNHPATPDAPIAINHIVEAPQDVDDSNNASTSISELNNLPAVRLVQLETHPWYKNTNGTVQMPQGSIPVKFTDAKKSMETTIPAKAAAILPLEYKALPKVPEDSWKNVRALGKGAFGSVVLQRRLMERPDGTRCEQLAAVKHSKWSQGATRDERALLRLMPRMEYALLRKLAKASHVVDALEMYEDPTRETCSIIMEYVPGVTLADWMCWNEGSIWRSSTCVALGFQLFSGIVEIRKHGITHADIKPENIMIKDGGHLIICDFGLAYVGDAVLMPGGTQLYTPPEVEGGVHTARDVYAAGTTLAEVIHYMCRGHDKASWETRLCEKITACRDEDWEARPSAARMQLFIRCLQMSEHKSPLMDERESRRLIEQQMKDDPPRKPSRAQTIRWTVEHRVRAVAAKAISCCRLP
ncbi:hypothetical protein FRB94_013309 [Tulasnella sp. JGI-2019a]|nr:hypothetical protein FRB94_013309 [Tulasnella sp. JGI-2019a]